MTDGDLLREIATLRAENERLVLEIYALKSLMEGAGFTVETYGEWRSIPIEADDA